MLDDISANADMFRVMHALLAAAKGLSDPTRVRILWALRSGELCVCELCDALEVTQSTLSTHLQRVRASGLVTTRREGRWTYYALRDSGRTLLDALTRLFAGAVETDRRLTGDARRLQARLALRQQGACCVGFACRPHPRTRRKAGR